MSTEYCKYTCPAVDAEMEDMIGGVFNALSNIEIDGDTLKVVEEIMRASCEKMKEVGTYKLRDGLDSCYSDLQDANRSTKEAEGNLSDAEETIAHKENEISNLEDQISELEHRIESLEE